MCQNCGKHEANVRYTQIINGIKKELHLCQDCAKKLGIEPSDMPDFLNVNSFLGDFFNDYIETSPHQTLGDSEIKCKKCNMTYEDFIKTGMFGCSNCYETFTNPINSLLKNLHGTSKHTGRTPKNLYVSNAKRSESKKEQKDEDEKKETKQEDKLARLQKDLEKAIKDERYEDAAKIRDQIKEMNK